MGIFLCGIEGIKGPVLLPNQSHFLPVFLTQVIADSWADIFPKASVDLAPVFVLPLSPSLSLFLPVWFSAFSFLYFCLRKARDIHDTEANNVELTKYLRPYPSNETITICSEDKPAIIHRILYTNSITCEGDNAAPSWVLSLSQRKWSVSFWCSQPKESKYDLEALTTYLQS